MSFKIKKLLCLALLLSIIISSASGCSQDVETIAIVIPPKSVKLQTLTKENYSDTLNYSGYVAARDTKNFSFQLAGKVNEVNVEKGQSVKKGQVLAKLDTQNIQMGIDNANEGILLAKNGIQQTQSAINKINIGIEAEKVNLVKLDSATEAEKLNTSNIETGIEADKITLNKMESEYDIKISQLQISYELKKTDFDRIKQLFEAGAASQQQRDNSKSDFDNIVKEIENAKSNKENDMSLQRKSIELKENNLEIEKINIQNLENDRQLQEIKIRDLENDLETTNLKLEAANIQLNQSNISLEQNMKQLNDSVLVSSIDGFVLDIKVKSGEVTGAGTPVVIIKTGEQVVNVGIPVENYEKVKSGMAVSMKVSEESFEGIINTVSLYPDEATRTYNIEITPEKKDLATGSLVDIQIPIEQKEGYFAPITSVTNIDGLNYIYRLEKNLDDNTYTAIRMEVDLGKINGERVLLNNITEDIDIIPENIKDIKENDRVTVIQ